MPNGFIGASVRRFLEGTNKAMTAAGSVHDRKPFEGVSVGEIKVIVPAIPSGSNQRFPINPTEAMQGTHMTGVGRSSNIVVNQAVYEDAGKRLDRTDDRAGEEIYKIATAIEEMCADMYIVPSTVPKVLAITGQIKDSLGRFRAATENVNIETRRFVNEISRIDQSDGAFLLAIQESAATQAIQSVSNAVQQQASNMRETSMRLADTAEALALEAQELRDSAARSREEILQTRDQVRGLYSSINDIQANSSQRPMSMLNW